VTNQQNPTENLERAREAVQRLSPDRLCLGGLLDLGGVVGGVVDKFGAFLLGLFGVGPIGNLVSAGIAELVSKLLRRLLERWGIAKNETIECLRNIVNTAKEASQYIDDEGLRDVVEEVAKKWGWDVDTFRRFVKTAAGKSVTEDEVRRMIEEALEDIEEELENIKRNIEEKLRKVESKIEGSKIGIGIFFLNDVENGLLYGNFTVEGGVPKIETWVGTAKNEQNKQSELKPPKTDLVDAGKFRKVAEEVFSRLVKNSRVVLIGPRGIGKSTLATYVVWRSLRGSLGSVALDKPMDAVIRVDSLNPGDAVELNNLIKTAGRRFVVIYDPSPIKAYYKPEAMQVVEHGNKSVKNITLKELVESVKNTLKELMEVRNAWVVIILPSELYDEVSKSEELRNILNEIKSYIIDVDLKDEEFLREIIKRYSECNNVSDDLVRRVMDFDSYTLVAKYVGIWLRERECKVEDVDMALRESAGKPKLFFAHYIWGTILGKSMDLAMKVSVPLILHAAFGPIPEGITYITKAGIEGGAWKLIDRDSLVKSKLEDLREDDLEPIAKWLSTLHEDLIEETLEELVGLRDEEASKHYIDHGFRDLIETLKRSYEKALEEVRGLSREVEPEDVVTNLLTLTGERLKHALKPYTNCWKRAALIIGHALTWHPIVPRPEDLPESLRGNVAESLGNALNRCGVDDYLLVGNKIPPLIRYLTYTRASTEAFIDKYNEAVAEVNRILKIARGRGSIKPAESFYGLGLASIIARAVESGKPVGPSDADAALHIASIAIHSVALPGLILLVLGALEPLHGKAPHRYIELLASVSDMVNLDSGTVRYIFDKLNEILGNYGDVVKEHAWSLVYAIDAYAVLLREYFGHFNSEEVGVMVGRVVGLFNELGRFKSKLGVIAWAVALTPALRYEYVRGLMEEKLGIDVVGKASEVLGELGRLRDGVQELMGDEEFMSYIESWSVKADEETVKEGILRVTSLLKHALAIYRLDNNELDEAEKLFNEVAKEYEEIGDYRNYLAASSWALRVKAIKDSLVGRELKELVDGFRQLYEEAFNEEHFEHTAEYLSIASGTLGNYLVSLVLTGNYEMINELLEKHLWVLNAYGQVSVLTRLTLNALLRPRGRLSGELEGKLSVNPEELIDAFGYGMPHNSLPALMVAFRMISPEDGIKLCEEFNDEVCIYFVSAVKGNSVAVKRLREGVINAFNAFNNSLKGFGFDANALTKLINEFRGLVYGLDGKSLVQLIAPETLMARLALMLHALINGDKELAKAHALIGIVEATGSKLLTRLFLETYKECCDLGSEEFRRAIARLFFSHV
jgi:hypothetical protein